jgi:hypothetical protein
MGSTRTGRFDRVIPTVGLVHVGQGPAETVVHALPRIGDEGDTLPKQSRVPFSIILHITMIRALLANRRRARDEHTSVAASAMTASG